jgi:hypothetical protein
MFIYKRLEVTLAPTQRQQEGVPKREPFMQENMTDDE